MSAGSFRPLRSLRRALRRAIAAAGALILSRRMRRRAVPAELQRILVIRVDERVGNVLLTSPLLVALTGAYPRARVDALIAASKTALVEGLAAVIPFERRHFFRRPLAFLRLLRSLHDARYDVAIDASHWHEPSLSSALLLGWTGAPLRIAHAGGEARRFATHVVPLREDCTEVEAKLSLLAPLELAPAEVALVTHLGVRGAARAEIDGWLGTRGLAGVPLVGLAPGARKQDHRAPPEIFAAAGREAQRLGARALVLWGPGEEELAQEVARAAGAELAPPTNLEALAALMRACRVVLTNDTGPMHLAVACGTTTIALFLHGDHRRWGHSHPPNVVIIARQRDRDQVVEEVKLALGRTLQIPVRSD